MSNLIQKVWGTEEVLYNNEYCMKVLTLRPGFQSSLHYHEIKHETFLVVKGVCDLEINGLVRRLKLGDYQVIAPGAPHRFQAINDSCIIVEASTRHDDLDVVRLEESRKLGEGT